MLLLVVTIPFEKLAGLTSALTLAISPPSTSRSPC
jgi:hypothetical protein